MISQEQTDPIKIFKEWFKGAHKCGLEEPTAVMLATADNQGRPSARMVLLKSYSERGFVFYTNLRSRKGRQLESNPFAALCFHWMPLGRQVRIEGAVSSVSKEEADSYFSSRERGSQIGAWASIQSSELIDSNALHGRIKKYEKKFSNSDVPRPEFWSGFCLDPDVIEFWEHGPSRLHERTFFERKGSAWERKSLYP